MTIEIDSAPRLEVTARAATKRVETELGLSARDLASALDVDRRTLERWIASDTYPRRETRRRVAILLRLLDRLGDTFTDSEMVREWLNGPSRYLGGMRPIDALRAGRIDRVDAALGALDAGIFL